MASSKPTRLRKDLPAENNGAVYTDEEGKTWFAPISGGLYWLKDRRVGRVTVAGLDKDVVYSITGGDGQVWVGRQHGGLTVVKERGDSFSAQTYTRANGLPQDSIYSVYRARDGSVWAGSVSGGVSRLKDGVFSKYSVVDGLASDTINSIVEDSDGTMWFATRMVSRPLQTDIGQIALLKMVCRPATYYRLSRIRGTPFGSGPRRDSHICPLARLLCHTICRSLFMSRSSG